MLGWLRNMLAPDVADFRTVDNQQDRNESGPIQLRRWDGAATHRLNKEQFADVTGRSINEDLVTNLRMLVDRCTYEATTNGTIEGMIETHCIDLLGPEGPGLQVLPKRPIGLSAEQLKEFTDYATQAEEYLEDWCECCNYNEDMSFVELLELHINALWMTGNPMCQVLPSRGQSKGVGSIRLHEIHAQRVLHTFRNATEDGERVILGVHRDSWGKAKEYYVQEANDFGTFTGSNKFLPIPADQMIHDFKRREPGQIAGVPLLAPVLPAIGDLRQFDKLTIEAAKIAASQGIIFEDKFPDAPIIKGKANGGTYTAKLGTASLMHAPRGSEVKQIDPKHPSSRYVEFRNERWRDIGRIAQMPLMIARLNASGLPYAAARIESQLYQRGIRRDQSRLLRRYRPTLGDVLREAELAGAIPMRPQTVQIGASWPRLPHVDPSKESKARESDLKTLSTTLIDVWAENGQRPHVQVEKLRRAVDMLNAVKEGLGDSYISNMMQEKAPSVVDQVMEKVETETEESQELETNEV